jgi:hypothetical protein
MIAHAGPSDLSPRVTSERDFLQFPPFLRAPYFYGTGRITAESRRGQFLKSPAPHPAGYVACMSPRLPFKFCAEGRSDYGKKVIPKSSACGTALYYSGHMRCVS